MQWILLLILIGGIMAILEKLSEISNNNKPR